MAIIATKDTRLVVQGITGREGTFHALRNRDYGTNVVAGAARQVAGLSQSMATYSSQQAATLEALVSEVCTDDKMRAGFLKFMNVATVVDITAGRYGEAVRALEIPVATHHVRGVGRTGKILSVD
jgi:hypothetical protein